MSAAQTMDKSRPTSTLSEKANRPSLKISIPSIPSRPFTPEEPYSDEIAAIGSLPHENISPKDRTFVGIGGDSTTKKAQMPVISFSESCNSPPTKFTVPISPPPRAYEWYDSDQSEETSPNLSDTFDDTMDSLLDSYLRQDTHAAHHSPSSNYSPYEETDEDVSEYWDEGFPGPYGAEDFLECLYDAYLDEDMTSELVDK